MESIKVITVGVRDNRGMANKAVVAGADTEEQTVKEQKKL